ncbi:hypothetical protein FHS86_000595 [Roseimarinus sediminis]
MFTAAGGDLPKGDLRLQSPPNKLARDIYRGMNPQINTLTESADYNHRPTERNTHRGFELTWCKPGRAGQSS